MQKFKNLLKKATMILNRFARVLASDDLNLLIIFDNLIKEKNATYSFMIVDADRCNKNGTHCLSILGLYPRKEMFFFESFGQMSLKKFTVQDDQKQK